MYCRQCGYNNDNYVKVCKRCGSMLYAEDSDFDHRPQADLSEHVGGLRYAPKKEKLSDRIRHKFARLQRASRLNYGRVSVIAAISVIAVCLIVFGIVIALKLRGSDSELVYANDSCDIAQNCFAAADDDFLFYSSPYGNNPGLYRITLSTGQRLKIGYRCLECLSVLDGWLYGIDSDGCPLRISADGTVTQYICDDSPVSFLSVAGDHCYFISSGHHMFRVGLDFPKDEAGAAEAMNRAEPEQLSEDMAGCMLLSDDRIYYTTLTIKALMSSPETSGDAVPTVVCSSTGYPTGEIWSMNLDGTDASPIIDEQAFAISTKGSYIYFFTESTETVSYTDVYPPSTETTAKTKKTKKKTTTTEPPPKNIDVIRIHSWRYSMRTNGYASFLSDDRAISPIYIAGNAIYYISKQGDLMTAELSGFNEDLIPTDTQKIDSVFELGDYVYYSSSVDSLYARVERGSIRSEILSCP